MTDPTPTPKPPADHDDGTTDPGDTHGRPDELLCVDEHA
jgi:hypothetical protein